MRERTAERRFRWEATQDGLLVVKVGHQGYPDQLVSWGRGHCWLEWKTPTGRLTRAQCRRIPEMRERGERVEVVTSVFEAWKRVNDWRDDWRLNEGSKT